jgi:hypothetical protein
MFSFLKGQLPTKEDLEEDNRHCVCRRYEDGTVIHFLLRVKKPDAVDQTHIENKS